MKKIMVIGALGQIGSELTALLRKKYGSKNVIATDWKTKPDDKTLACGPFEYSDVMDKQSLRVVIEKHGIDTIVNMAAILSATGEEHPNLAWNVNMGGLYNVLELARSYSMDRVMVPSSIAVFGPETPRDNTPQDTILKPTTMYGVTKVAGELLGNYYVRRFKVDVRGLRYPGIISSETLPGGGTTDYAVAIYYDAIKYKKYTCFVKEDTRLPMMYMPDCLKATMDLLHAPFDRLNNHCDYNVGSMSFTVGEMAESIRKFIPDFEIEYKPDHRQKIADSWPMSVDDSAARDEWGWEPSYDLDSMTGDMLKRLEKKLN